MVHSFCCGFSAFHSDCFYHPSVARLRSPGYVVVVLSQLVSGAIHAIVLGRIPTQIQVAQGQGMTSIRYHDDIAANHRARYYDLVMEVVASMRREHLLYAALLALVLVSAGCAGKKQTARNVPPAPSLSESAPASKPNESTPHDNSPLRRRRFREFTSIPTPASSGPRSDTPAGTVPTTTTRKAPTAKSITRTR